MGDVHELKGGYPWCGLLAEASPVGADRLGGRGASHLQRGAPSPQGTAAARRIIIPGARIQGIPGIVKPPYSTVHATPFVTGPI